MLIAFGKPDVSILLDSLMLMAQDLTQLHEHNMNKGGLGKWTHEDGWGIAYLKKGEWHIHRSETNISKDPEVDKYRNLQADVILLHARFMTEGELSLEDTHPFQLDNFVFCHNGTIRGKIPHSACYKTKGSTDSERMFYNILSDFSSDKPEVIREKLNEVEIHTGSNIILVDSKKTYIGIHFKTDPIYYKMAVGGTDDFLVISSEKLKKVKVKWKLLEHGDVVVVDNKTRKFKVLKEKYK